MGMLVGMGGGATPQLLGDGMMSGAGGGDVPCCSFELF